MLQLLALRKNLRFLTNMYITNIALKISDEDMEIMLQEEGCTTLEEFDTKVVKALSHKCPIEIINIHSETKKIPE
jgi:hypothetical protein